MPGALTLSTAAQPAADLTRYGFGRAHSFATQKQIPFRDPKPIRHSCRDLIVSSNFKHIVHSDKTGRFNAVNLREGERRSFALDNTPSNH